MKSSDQADFSLATDVCAECRSITTLHLASEEVVDVMRPIETASNHAAIYADMKL
jgi:hypothetical protein